jgi:hypothetical protein
MNDPLLISRGSGGNAAWVRLSASLEDSLDWQEGIDAARRHIEAGRRIFWEIDLGWEKGAISLEDELVFKGMQAAIHHFSETVYPQFQEQTVGAALYRGPIMVADIDRFASYLQRLSYRLNPDLPPYLLFDAGAILRTEVLHLLSKERFERFELAVRNAKSSFWALDWEGKGSPWGWIGEGEPPSIESPTIGVLFPEKRACSHQVLAEIEEIFQKLDPMPYRVVSEPFLSEEWEGLDTIVVLSHTVQMRGKRQLMGFCAAGGLVATAGPLLGLANETEIKFGAEGFEPPTYWSQTSRASQTALYPDQSSV